MTSRTLVPRTVAGLVALLVVLGGLAPGVTVRAVQPTVDLPSSAPVITAPEPGASGATEPLLAWTPVPGAGHYAVQIAADDTFADPVYDVVTASAVATPELDLAPRTWHWRVAVDEGGLRGPWAASSFVKQASLGTPTPTAPADAAVIEHPDAPVLAWSPVSGAHSYEIQLARDPAFTDPFPALTGTTSLVADFAVPGDTFHWRVRAVARNGTTTGPWSAAHSFSAAWTGVPSGLQPADGAQVADVALSWDPLPGAARYEVRVTPGPIPDWDSAATRTLSSAATWIPIEDPAIPVSTTWSWQVRAIAPDPDDAPGPWSPARSLTRTPTPAPVLQAPADGAVTGTVVTMAWSPVVRASRYEVQVSADPAFATGVSSHTTTEASFDLTTAEEVAPYVLVMGTLYHWRVRAYDGGAVHLPPGLPASAWSAARTFTWEPDVAELLAPADGAAVQVPTLAWDPADARVMRVTIEDADGVIVAREVTYATSYTPVEALDPADGPFTWYVERVALPGDDEATAAWRSAERTFSLEPVTGAGASPEPLLAPDARFVRTPSIGWTPVAGAHHYRLYLWLMGEPLPDPLPDVSWSPVLAYPAWTYPDGNLDTRPYNYTPVAFDAADQVIAIGSGAVFHLDAPAAPVITAPDDCGADTCPAWADTPRLAWDPVADAGFYNVSTYDPWVGGGGSTPATSFMPTADLGSPPAGGPKTWGVAACVENRCSPHTWAELRITIPAPVMVSPAAGAVIEGPEVRLDWDALVNAPAASGTLGTHTSEALSYMHGLIGEPVDGIVGCCGGSGSQGTETAAIALPGTYTWELWAYTGNGMPSEHSTRQLTVTWDGPAPAAPSNGAVVDRTPVLRWAAAAYADTYDVEVFRGASTDPADRVLQLRTVESAVIPFAELAAGTYTWRIRAGLGGPASDWDPTATFTIEDLAPVTLIAPADSEADGTGLPLFAWEPVAGAVAYRFESDDDPAFASPRESVVTGQTRWAPLAAYSSDTWTWRVQALGASGAAIATSAPHELLVDLADPVVTAPSEALARARASSTGAAPVDVAWQGSDTQAGGVRYDLWRSTDGGMFVQVASAVASPAVRTSLAPGHTYRYAVEAVDAAGHRSAREYGSTFRVRAHGDGPATVTYRATWRTVGGAGFVGGSARTSSTPGARAVFRFTGRQVAWVAAIGPSRGKARVYVDGHYAATVNLHATDAATRRVVFTRTWATAGDHRVRVEVVGTAGHPRVDVDGFVTIR